MMPWKWDTKGVQTDMNAIIQQAEIIWPAHTRPADGGFERVIESDPVKNLRARRDGIPKAGASVQTAYQWTTVTLELIRELGKSRQAHDHPNEWRKIQNRFKTIRDKFPRS